MFRENLSFEDIQRKSRSKPRGDLPVLSLFSQLIDRFVPSMDGDWFDQVMKENCTYVTRDVVLDDTFLLGDAASFASGGDA